MPRSRPVAAKPNCSLCNPHARDLATDTIAAAHTPHTHRWHDFVLLHHPDGRIHVHGKQHSKHRQCSDLIYLAGTCRKGSHESQVSVCWGVKAWPCATDTNGAVPHLSLSSNCFAMSCTRCLSPVGSPYEPRTRANASSAAWFTLWSSWLDCGWCCHKMHGNSVRGGSVTR